MTTTDFLLSKVEKRPGRNKVELEKGKEKKRCGGSDSIIAAFYITVETPLHSAYNKKCC